MRFRALALIPLALLAALLASAWLLDDESARRAAAYWLKVGAKVLATSGFALAALSFSRGDYLRRGWGAHAIGTSIVLLRDLLLLGPGPDEARRSSVDLLDVGMVVISNALGAYGSVLMARAWRVAGFELDGTRAARRMVWLAAAVITVLVVTPASLQSIRQVAGSNWLSLAGLASSIGDAVSLVCMAPILLTVMALRGGALVGPWAWFMAAQLCWLGYDATHASLVEDSFRLLALGCSLAAGIAQHRVIRGITRGAAQAAPR